ncbi:MAG: glycosyltransferase involved in cell wall biosynthesis [Lentimonas sp.]|jgi:glycosyltransferase involved in cell wall biosynthesis
MRIVIVTETYPPEINGVAMTNQRLVRGLIERGHQILLIKPRRADFEAVYSDALQVHEVFGVPIPNYAGLKLGLPGLGELNKRLAAYQPDLVHVATEGPLGFCALRAARKQKIPVSSTFHTNFQDYCADYGAAILQRYMMAYLRWFHNACALTTVPDPSLIERLSDAGVERLAMLGRGADTALFSPQRRSTALRASWGVDATAPVALYVGRVAAEKNIPLTIRAWQAARQDCPELKLVIVGDGPIRKKLQKQWPEVHFAGMRYDADLAAHYASADLFLFASTSETFGNVVVEAMSSGLVVLCYDYAAGRQFIRHSENGYIVPLDDAAALIQQTKDLLQQRSHWPVIQAEARRTAETYPWAQTIDRFERLLQHVVLGTSSQP